jgi:hypothetical protein
MTEKENQVLKLSNHLAKTLNSFEVICCEAKNGRKINELTDREIVVLLQSLMALVGISPKNIPVDDEFMILVNNFKLCFDEFSDLDFTAALKLAIKGQINFNFNLYDRMFSIVYLSELMKAYKPCRQEAIYKNDRLLNSETMESQEEIRQKNLQAGRASFIRIYKEFKENPVFKTKEAGYYETMSCIYDYLTESNIITIPNDRKKNEMQKAERRYKQKLEAERLELSDRENLLRINNQLKNWEKTLIDEKEIIKNIAKTLIIEDYISSSIDLEMDLSDIL